MTRRLYPAAMRALALLATGLFALSACGGGDDGGGDVALTTFRGEGYQVGYPSAWQKAPNGRALIQDAKWEVLDLPSGATVPNASLHVLLTKASSPSLDLALQDLLGTSYAKTSGFKETGRKKIEVTGAGGGYEIRSSYDNSQPDGTMIKLQEADLVVQDGRGNLLNVRIICRDKRCPAYKNMITAVFKSVRLVK